MSKFDALEFYPGDLVKVIENVHDSDLPAGRVGIIIEMLPIADKNIADQAQIMFSNWSVLKFHICHLKKVCQT